MDKVEIIKLLATTKSDDFTSAGKGEGVDAHAVVQALADSGDRYLTLKALQLAYALGIRSAYRVMAKHDASATWNINDTIEAIEHHFEKEEVNK